MDMVQNEWSDIWRSEDLGLNVLHAFFNTHAFPRHSHDYYVIALVQRGRQAFYCAGSKYTTPPDGLIMINPGEVHTGEPLDARGYEMLSFYPTTGHIRQAMEDLTGDSQPLPYFTSPRAGSRQIAGALRRLYHSLRQQHSYLACESQYFLLLTLMIRLFANKQIKENVLGNERRAVRKAVAFIQRAYEQPISLSQLAAHVNLSRYYFLRVFEKEVGMPPHRYLENVRIRHAQRMIESGHSLTNVAHDTGYSSQSHFTQRFKRVIGTTPGRYAQQIH